VELELGGGVGPRSDRDLTTAVKYGLGERTEIFVCGQPYVRQSSGGEILRGRSATNLGWRHRFEEWNGGDAGVQVLVLPPDGSEREGFASGETDVFLAGILDGYDEHVAWTAFYQLGSLGDDGSARDTQHALALILGSSLSAELDGFAEVFGEFTPARSENPVAAQLGVAWNQSPRHIWDVALQFGLNDDAPGTRVLFGLTWNLGPPVDA